MDEVFDNKLTKIIFIQNIVCLKLVVELKGLATI